MNALVGKQKLILVILYWVLYNKLVARLANSPCLHNTAELYVQEFPKEIKKALKKLTSTL